MSICKHRDCPSICGRPRWTISPSISRTTRRTKGSWEIRVASATRPAFVIARSACDEAIHTLPRHGLLRFARNDGGTISLPHPFRRALFRKRLRPLDVILRGRHRLYGRVFALFGDRLFQRDRKPLLDRLLGGAD